MRGDPDTIVYEGFPGGFSGGVEFSSARRDGLCDGAQQDAEENDARDGAEHDDDDLGVALRRDVAVPVM